jgi:hypothetical protein
LRIGWLSENWWYDGRNAIENPMAYAMPIAVHMMRSPKLLCWYACVRLGFKKQSRQSIFAEDTAVPAAVSFPDNEKFFSLTI